MYEVFAQMYKILTFVLRGLGVLNEGGEGGGAKNSQYFINFEKLQFLVYQKSSAMIISLRISWQRIDMGSISQA